jgi:excisionase family DNA binding protein
LRDVSCTLAHDEARKLRKRLGEPRLPLLLSAADAANELGVSVRTVMGLIAAGELEVTRIGARITRVRRESLLRLAAKGLATDSIRPRKAGEGQA